MLKWRNNLLSFLSSPIQMQTQCWLNLQIKELKSSVQGAAKAYSSDIESLQKICRVSICYHRLFKGMDKCINEAMQITVASLNGTSKLYLYIEDIYQLERCLCWTSNREITLAWLWGFGSIHLKSSLATRTEMFHFRHILMCHVLSRFIGWQTSTF